MCPTLKINFLAIHIQLSQRLPSLFIFGSRDNLFDDSKDFTANNHNIFPLKRSTAVALVIAINMQYTCSLEPDKNIKLHQNLMHN